MANVIKIKKSSESGKVPVSTDLTQGELAINTADQKLYSYDGSSVFELTYTAGTNVAISGSNVISSTDTNTTYDSSDFLPATGGTLTGNLDVTGSITAYDSSSTANPRLAVGRSTNENLEFSVEDLNGKIIYKQDSDTNASHNLIFDIDAAGTGSKAFQFKLGGTEKLEINSTGLDVTGTVTADGLTFGSNHRIQGTGGLFLGGSSATVFEVGAGSEKMRLTSTGLGIGEPSPITPLHIDKVGGAIIHLADDAATADGAKLGGISSGNSVESFYAGINFFRHDSNDGEIRFRHKVAGSNTDVMTLVDGKVGIGSSSPGYKLEIATDTNSTVNLLLLRNSDSTYSQTFGFQLDTNKDLVITGSSGSGGVHFNAGSRGYLFDGGNISISSGNLTLSGTVDGRDVATDGTKLDTIAFTRSNRYCKRWYRTVQ